MHRTDTLERGSVHPLRPLIRAAARGWDDAGMGPQRTAVLAVWAATVVGVVLVVALVPGSDALAALALVLALAVVAGFVAQLAAGQQRGFVAALAASTSGSFVLVLAGAVVASLAG